VPDRIFRTVVNVSRDFHFQSLLNVAPTPEALQTRSSSPSLSLNEPATAEKSLCRPHYHGSAGVQVVNGMAGLILVKGPIDKVPEIAAARDELLAIQNLKINPLDGDSREWGR
jgi:hypothetical protein